MNKLIVIALIATIGAAHAADPAKQKPEPKRWWVINQNEAKCIIAREAWMRSPAAFRTFAMTSGIYRNIDIERDDDKNIDQVAIVIQLPGQDQPERKIVFFPT